MVYLSPTAIFSPTLVLLLLAKLTVHQFPLPDSATTFKTPFVIVLVIPLAVEEPVILLLVKIKFSFILLLSNL